MARRKLSTSAQRRREKRIIKQREVEARPFSWFNGGGTTEHLVQCEVCSRKHPGGKPTEASVTPCMCGSEMARYATLTT